MDAQPGNAGVNWAHMAFYAPVALRRKGVSESMASVDRYCDMGTFMALLASHGFNVSHFVKDYIIYLHETSARQGP